MSVRLAAAQGARHHKQLWRGMVMQGLQSIRLDLEQIDRLRRSAFGEHGPTATQ